MSFPFDPSDAFGADGESNIVMLGPTPPLPLTLVPTPHHLAPEGTTMVEVFHGENRLSRFAVLSEALAPVLTLFAEPAPILFAAFEADPGIQGRLIALVPHSKLRSLEPGAEDEPWKSDTPSFEEMQVDPFSASFEEGALSDAVRMHPFPLGDIVRIAAERKFPEDLLKEAEDIFGKVLRGQAGDVLDRMLKNMGL